MITQSNPREPIKLRGHHVVNIFCKNFIGVFPYLGDLVKKSYHKIIGTNEMKEEELKTKELYDESLTKKWISIFRANPDICIEIVDGLDSICQDCPFKKDSCAMRRNISEDDFCVESYDLKVGETYTVRDLAKRARDYAKKPNVSRDPRTQFKMLCLYYGILSPRDLIEAGEKQ